MQQSMQLHAELEPSNLPLNILQSFQPSNLDVAFVKCLFDFIYSLLLSKPAITAIKTKTTTKATTTITTTVPQQKQWKNLNGMTDPPSKMHLRGAVPPSKMHLGGNLTFYHLFS